MIRLAKIDDIPSIMVFIDSYWKQGHILSKDIDLFNYQYVFGNKVNMALSFDDNSNINGFLGFIPYSNDYKQISLAMWKALSSNDGFIGLKLLDFVVNEVKPEIISTPGVNPSTTESLYKFLGYEFGKMNHYYRLYKKDDYSIALINDYNEIEHKETVQYKLTKINDIEMFNKINISYDKNSFNKSMDYIKHRYYDNKYYNYDLYYVENNGSKLVIILKKQEANNSCCLRIIDMLGDYKLLNNIVDELDLLANSCNAEYIDCYCSGIDDEIFANSGFAINDGTNVIPDYFYPFEQRNIDIFYSSNVKNRVLFKGDGDMDRPN